MPTRLLGLGTSRLKVYGGNWDIGLAVKRCLPFLLEHLVWKAIIGYDRNY